MCRISRCDKSDAPALAELEKQCFEYPFSGKDFENEFENNPFAAIIALWIEESLIGYLEYMVTYDSSTVVRIGVLPAFRRKGFASRLFHAMFEELKALEEPPSTSTLEVSVDNVGAIALYRKEGYVEASVKKGYYKDGSDAIYMVKGL